MVTPPPPLPPPPDSPSPAAGRQAAGRQAGRGQRAGADAFRLVGLTRSASPCAALRCTASVCVCPHAPDENLFEWAPEASRPQLLAAARADPTCLPQLRALLASVHASSAHALAAELHWLLALFRLRCLLLAIPAEGVSRASLFPAFLQHAYGDSADKINKTLHKLTRWFDLATAVGARRPESDGAAAFLSEMFQPPPPPSSSPHGVATPVAATDEREQGLDVDPGSSPRLSASDAVASAVLQQLRHSLPSPPARLLCRSVPRRSFECLSPRLPEIQQMCLAQHMDFSEQLRRYLHAPTTAEMERVVSRDLYGMDVSGAAASSTTAAAACLASRSEDEGIAAVVPATPAMPASQSTIASPSPSSSSPSSPPSSSLPSSSLSARSSSNKRKPPDADDLRSEASARSSSAHSPVSSDLEVEESIGSSSPLPQKERSHEVKRVRAVAAAEGVCIVKRTKRTSSPHVRRGSVERSKSLFRPGDKEDPDERTDTSGNSDAEDTESCAEAWPASCADDFAGLMERYPLQLAPAPRITLAAADAFLQSTDPLDAAFVVTNLLARDGGGHHDEAVAVNGVAQSLSHALTHTDTPKMVLQQRPGGSLRVRARTHACRQAPVTVLWSVAPIASVVCLSVCHLSCLSVCLPLAHLSSVCTTL